MSKLPKNSLKLLVIGLLILGLFFLPAIARLFADISWFKSIGFYSVFIIPFTTRVLTGVAVFALVTTVLLLNFRIFNRVSQGRLYVSPQAQGSNIIQQPKEVGRIAKKVFIGVSIFIGLLTGLAASGAWQTVLKFIHQQPFDQTDPVFGYDIAYYVFTLPFLEIVTGILFFLLLISLIITVILYGWHILYHHLGQKVKFWGRVSVPFVPETAKRHLTVLLSAFFLLTAFHLYAISLPSLLLKEHELLSGANYVDLHAHLPVTYGLIGISLLAVLAGAYMLVRGRYGLWVPVAAVYIGAAVLGGGVYPGLLQSLVVAPNELSKESANLERHVTATQKGWGLEGVQVQELSGDQKLTLEDLEQNRETINNIRLWDRGPLLDTFSQLQEIRTYYNFNSLDTERYQLNGKYQQLSLAPRELDYSNLPKRNFINERLTYTHGMGAAVAPVNEVTEEGLPRLYVKDLPPTSTQEKLQIDQPAIYYGEDQSDYVIANTASKEFHYPGQEENVYANYDGQGGVSLASPLSRALLAINFGSYKIFLNSDIREESRILYHRNVRERIQKALPFLELDSDPYLVVANGRLKWIQDAYTTSHRYPYSAEMNGVNYMRNSVKVVMDAYDGDINAYVVDREDPLIQTYASIFPDIFQPGNEMPEALQAHIRYPEDLFSLQSTLYTEYHMEDPQNFYNKEDLWNFPELRGTTRGETVGPVMRRLIMRLPGEDTEEYVLMLPYTPEGKNNMISWLAARSDGEHYGELVNYRFPKKSLAYGPQQIVSRINQQTEISQQISLWDQRGSEVLQGNLYVIPIEESILYIRPLYLRAEDSRMPELKRVIVAHKDSIAMAPTLDAALEKVFGTPDQAPADGDGDGDAQEGEGEGEAGQTPPRVRQLAKEARRLFEQARQAQRQGNWPEYGRLEQELEAKLNELESQTGQ